MKQQFVEGKRLLKGGILCVAVVWCNGVRGGVGTNEKKLQSRKGPEDIGMPCGLFSTGAQELYDRVDKKVLIHCFALRHQMAPYVAGDLHGQCRGVSSLGATAKCNAHSRSHVQLA